MKRLHICTALLAAIVILSVISNRFISDETDKLAEMLQAAAINPNAEKISGVAKEWEKFRYRRLLVPDNESIRTITSLFYHLSSINNENEVKPVANEIILNLRDLKRKQFPRIENIF